MNAVLQITLIKLTDMSVQLCLQIEFIKDFYYT